MAVNLLLLNSELLSVEEQKRSGRFKALGCAAGGCEGVAQMLKVDVLDAAVVAGMHFGHCQVQWERRVSAMPLPVCRAILH